VLRSSDYSVPTEVTFDVFHDANAPVFDRES
jgi:hypothetical protein